MCRFLFFMHILTSSMSVRYLENDFQGEIQVDDLDSARILHVLSRARIVSWVSPDKLVPEMTRRQHWACEISRS